jgi:murein DD-endopeptidase MepM/ murein hydrolase activator NlpD
VVVAIVGLALLLAMASAGGARLGVWAHETRVAPELASVQARLAGAESRLRTLGDSLATLRVELARVASLAAPSALRSGAPARAGGATVVAPRRRPPAFPLTGLVLPLDGRITSRFARSRVHPILRINRPHRGVDIGAPSGTQIIAPAAGRVVKVGREMGYGLVVHLDHGNGVTTRYAHCQSTLVSRGQRVAVGTPIATVGATGLATRPHLHYEVRLKGEAVDPLRVSVR